MLEGLKPDYWVIAEFRRNNGDMIHAFTKTFRKFLKDSGYIGGKRIVFDGSKIKAYTNRSSISKENVENCITEIDTKLEQYINDLGKTDCLEDKLDEANSTIEGLISDVEQLTK